MSLQVTIGTAPCSWGVWWPDGTPSGTPYNVFLDQAAEAGYKALELGPVGYLPTDIGQLRDELASRGLSICGGTACYDFLKAASFADVRADVDELCKRLLASVIVYMALSLMMAVLWSLLQSPDLAITEAAVGAGVTSILFFLTLKKIHALKGTHDE